MKDIQYINDSMNELYEIADKVESHLKSKNISYDRGDFTNHYIKINNKEYLQKFKIPVFTIKDKGDIGINIDGIFLELAVKKEKLSNKILQNVLNDYPLIEIYGYKDCLCYFYKKGDDSDKVIDMISKSDEDVIQFNLQLDLNSNIEEIIESFEKVSNLIKGKKSEIDEK